MAINTALLIAAPMLQNYFVDKTTGLPLTAGIISCYQDNNRTTFKNWYYQSGSPGAYTYITLPNPMTLSGVGTIIDGNGNDTIPFFYPYSETDNETPQPYYITVTDANDENQFVRQNFPFISTNGNPANIVPTLRNYLLNNVFWRNAGSLNVGTLSNSVYINPSTSYYYQTLCPSQHDGFSMPDIIYIKNINGATETLSFEQFTPGDGAGEVLTSDITPEFYMNLNCTGSISGETLKAVQIPISLHIKTLESVQATLAIHAQSVGGGSNNKITVSINQFLGTGIEVNPNIVLQTITLTNNWEKYEIPFTFPSAAGIVNDVTGDDALYLQIGYPLNAIFDINIALPQQYLSDTVPNNNFDTYDQIDTIINSPRTGDVRITNNSFYPYGWVPMNNGTIGTSTSNATSRANIDTWPLFNLLWSIAKPYDSGSNFNPICQMLTSAASNTNFGASAFVDYSANNQLALTKMFGNVMVGSVPISALLANYSQSITASNSTGSLLITVANGSVLFNGQTIAFTTTATLPGNIVANAIYYVSGISGNTFFVATSFENALAGTVIAYSSAGSSSKVTANITGSYFGENAHVQLNAEISPHVHTYNAPYQTLAFSGSGPSTAVIAPINSFNTGSTGSGAAFNIMQPGTFCNIFMKL